MSDLYDTIGGQRGMRTAVDVFYRRVLADPALKPFFAGIDLGRLAAHQRAFLASALGGPDLYGGLELATAHEGLQIDDAAFDGVTDHLLGTLRDLGADSDVRQAVSDRLEAYRSAVVTLRPDSHQSCVRPS
ncbi:MAG: group 1 truncated hemoglobin [Streptosporangiaceae bacterium]